MSELPFDVVFDIISSFLVSPEWVTPVHNFIDANCVSFLPVVENSHEHMKIYKEFQQLVSLLLECKLEEMGITVEEFEKVVENGKSKKKYHKRLTQILGALDDYGYFKNLMVNRNIELQSLAVAKVTTGEDPSTAPSAPTSMSAADAYEKEEADLRAAIALSLEEERRLLALLEREREEFEEALRRSLLDAAEMAMLQQALAEYDSRIAERKAVIASHCAVANISLPAEAVPSPPRKRATAASNGVNEADALLAECKAEAPMQVVAAEKVTPTTPSKTTSAAVVGEEDDVITRVAKAAAAREKERAAVSSLPAIFRPPPPPVPVLPASSVFEKAAQVVMSGEETASHHHAVSGSAVSAERMERVEQMKRLLMEKQRREREEKLQEFRKQTEIEQQQQQQAASAKASAPEEEAAKPKVQSALTRMLLKKQ